MEILQKIPVPTGWIVVVEGEKGHLEFLSIGDYGKPVNLNPEAPVPDNPPLLPLTEKWVTTISTQYGCSMGCQFCDVPAVGKGVNATLHDMQQQILLSLQLFPDVKFSNRLNIHYARMGEPTWNPNVLDHAKWMKDHIDPEYNVHPVLTTMMPSKNEWLKTDIHTWIRIKNRVYKGNAGLQVSINSTDEDERKKLFSGNALTLLEISRIFEDTVPVGRKFTLNFPVAENWKIDPEVLLRYFDTERFLVKLTPLHQTKASNRFGHTTAETHTQPVAYQELEEAFEKCGYEVLVFIASDAEEESMITCGHAVLAHRKQPRTREGELVFIGGKPVGEIPFSPWDAKHDQFEREHR
jgi:23S rRNA (adenine2503-C2)-methyltransferase